MTTYFKRDLFDFLKELSVNNNRNWFQANKSRYEQQVQAPFLRLITELGPGLKKINPYFVADPRPSGGSMMRIYRDIRFSKDKSPYKTFIAAHFRHKQGKEGATPGFYLRLEPTGSFIGAGIWRPESAALKQIRARIVRYPKDWQRTTDNVKSQLPLTFGGESLTRPPAGIDASHPLIDDLKRKDFVIGARLIDRQVLGSDFLDLLLARISAADPFVRFLSRSVGLR
ncbi:MAG TPA: DUF2461 domain-containing protein [Pyrinomonadaceae bacterium]|nr:DUF2461 domain-containing protein [Pyrinomonadaceae bacterium]